MFCIHSMDPEPSQNIRMVIDSGTIMRRMMSPLKLKSNQFRLCILVKAQTHGLSLLHNLYSKPHPLSLDPRLEGGKTCQDRHTIDVTCTEQRNKITIL